MLIVGVVTTNEPVAAIGFQEYVFAPDAVKVKLLPAQTVVGEANAVIVGFGLGFNVTVAVD